jgi:hypothetical protein
MQGRVNAGAAESASISFDTRLCALRCARGGCHLAASTNIIIDEPEETP